MTGERRHGIRELVQASGVPRRTVRYDVQLGLLPPPEGAGRGHDDLDDHLDRLLRIRELRDRGRGLEEIREILDCGDGSEREPPPAAEVELASHLRVAPGVELVVRHGGEAPTPSQLRALAAAAARILERREGR